MLGCQIKKNSQPMKFALNLLVLSYNKQGIVKLSNKYILCFDIKTQKNVWYNFQKYEQARVNTLFSSCLWLPWETWVVLPRLNNEVRYSDEVVNDQRGNIDQRFTDRTLSKCIAVLTDTDTNINYRNTH